jgi:lysophospholipase L1-like esterase
MDIKLAQQNQTSESIPEDVEASPMAVKQFADPETGVRQGKRTLWVIIFNLLVVVLVLGGLEFAFRQKHLRTVGPRSRQSRAYRDAWTVWRNSPYFRDTNGARHDAQGFRRDSDVSVEKSPDTVRIFLVGGSAAYGDSGGYPEIESRRYYLYNNQLIDYVLQEKLNAAFPSKRWEVINAATMEYRLHQELALIESVLLRYHPDYVILMDGYNDVLGLSSAGRQYDAYAATPHLDEFNLLANPGSGKSALFFAATWLKANSDLFRTLADHLQRRSTLARRGNRRAQPEFAVPVLRSELNAEEQAQFDVSETEVGEYTHTARQIHRILDLDGIRALFMLQPVTILSHKPLTESEQRIRAHTLKMYGPALAYTFEQLYPRMASQMQLAAQQDGFAFVDLTSVFDTTSKQTFSDYCHLTPEGHKVIAERVFEFLHDSFAEKARH